MKRLLIYMLLMLIGGSGMAQKSKTIKIDGVKFKMIYVPGGTFQMGGDGDVDEKPVHSVTINGYYIAETVVTEKLWTTVMGNNPSINPSNAKYEDKFPVTQITYTMSLYFINKLNQKTGLKFRLPTEAEWEYAAKGGNTGNAGSTGPTYDKHNRGVYANGVKKWGKDDTPNGLGIWYMKNGVWEWCSDYYGTYPSGNVTNPTGPTEGQEHVIRGGGYATPPHYCTTTYRASLDSNIAILDLGLRLAMSYEEKKKK